METSRESFFKKTNILSGFAGALLSAIILLIINWQAVGAFVRQFSIAPSRVVAMTFDDTAFWNITQRDPNQNLLEEVFPTLSDDIASPDSPLSLQFGLPLHLDAEPNPVVRIEWKPRNPSPFYVNAIRGQIFWDNDRNPGLNPTYLQLHFHRPNTPETLVLNIENVSQGWNDFEFNLREQSMAGVSNTKWSQVEFDSLYFQVGLRPDASTQSNLLTIYIDQMEIELGTGS